LLAEMMITVNVLVPEARNATVRDDVDLLLAAIRQTIQTYTVRDIDCILLFSYQDIAISVFLSASTLFTLYAHQHSLRRLFGTQGVPSSSCLLQLHVKFQPSDPLTCINVAHPPDLAIESIESIETKGELLPQGMTSCFD
jgi:hypothetical protein